MIFHKDGSRIKTPKIVVSIDEPFADRVFWMIKANQAKKGTDDLPDTFEEYRKQMYKTLEYGRKQNDNT